MWNVCARVLCPRSFPSKYFPNNTAWENFIILWNILHRILCDQITRTMHRYICACSQKCSSRNLIAKNARFPYNIQIMFVTVSMVPTVAVTTQRFYRYRCTDILCVSRKWAECVAYGTNLFHNWAMLDVCYIKWTFPTHNHVQNNAQSKTCHNTKEPYHTFYFLKIIDILYS